MPNEVLDLTIIGGGPTGLFGAFYAGVRGIFTRIIDSLPELGGQLRALYPEKDVFDVGGIPKILAKDLAKDMVAQRLQFGAEAILDEELRELPRDGDHFLLKGRNADYASRSVVIAGGKGTFEPMHLKAPGYLELLGKGVHYAVKDPEDYRGKKVLLVGGGDSALDWALALKDRAERLIMVHRRDMDSARTRHRYSNSPPLTPKARSISARFTRSVRSTVRTIASRSTPCFASSGSSPTWDRSSPGGSSSTRTGSSSRS